MERDDPEVHVIIFKRKVISRKNKIIISNQRYLGIR